jgi:hypothetical protein
LWSLSSFSHSLRIGSSPLESPHLSFLGSPMIDLTPCSKKLDQSVLCDMLHRLRTELTELRQTSLPILFALINSSLAPPPFPRKGGKYP